MKNKFETVEQLVKKRKGYKYLLPDGTSPYQHFVYDLSIGKRYTTDLDTNRLSDCGKGWNLATLEWILNDTRILDKIIVEFSIPKGGKIIVPKGSRGKFRTNDVVIKRVWNPEELFPEIKVVTDRLKDYTPTNPITATKCPSKKKILQVWDQVRDQVWAQVRAQVGAQVWDQVWDQVRDQVGAQVWAQVGVQEYICGYYAVKEFMNLDYDHPAFEFIRMGVMVVAVNGKLKVFGKGGKFLGEFDYKKPKAINESEGR
ncbi:MAG: hypothetical protein M0R06_11375 [Sphaerochaeta sp.]|jgi:hypothetical protein|nr:hypothetical protein [Sphaerochaeta sp.]